MENKQTNPFINLITHICLSLAVLLVLIPIFWLIIVSLKDAGGLYSLTIDINKLSFDNYRNLFIKTDFLNWLKNSLIVCILSSTLALFFTTTAGYAFSRFQFPGKKRGLGAILIIQMFPAMMGMVALYKLLGVISNLTNGVIGFNIFGLILIYTGGGLPFNIWLVKGYVDSLPKELEESAYIDGATPWQAFSRVVFPLMSPILVVIGIFTFIGAYNDFLIPSIVLMDSSQYTMAVGLRSFISSNFSTNWTMFAAAAMLGATPILIIFLSLQKFLVKGLTKGAVKG